MMLHYIYHSFGSPAPHLLELELLHALLIRGDGCALDANTVLQDGVSSVNGNLLQHSVLK
jgi:hypothetical protein